MRAIQAAKQEQSIALLDKSRRLNLDEFSNAVQNSISPAVEKGIDQLLRIGALTRAPYSGAERRSAYEILLDCEAGRDFLRQNVEIREAIAQERDWELRDVCGHISRATKQAEKAQERERVRSAALPVLFASLPQNSSAQQLPEPQPRESFKFPAL